MLYGNYEAFRFVLAVAQSCRRTFVIVNVQPAPLSWRLLLMMACAVAAIAETFSTPITTLLERLTGLRAGYGSVRWIDFASGHAKGTIVRAGTDANSFNAATSIIGRGAADAALFRESVERMDRP